ncbi:MAG: regulatory protein RecX [Actinomycetes bacterium]
MKNVDETDQPKADPFSFAKAIALRQLNLMPRSRKELATKMAAKGVTEEVSLAVLERLTEVGLVDDRGYAELLVRSKTKVKRLSRRALRMELLKKGIDPEIISQVLASVTDDDEIQMARELVEKKMRSLTKVDPVVAQRRLSGQLARKGYSHSVIMKVLNEHLD